MTGSLAQSGPGALVLVVGPSGAGKDTLIRFAAAHFGDDPRIRFARRIVTRAADSDVEDHDSLDEAQFLRLIESGGAALNWRAHGLGYALPIEIDGWIADGATVIANVSRRVVSAAARKYTHVAVVHVTAPADILRKRLLARSRDDGTDVEERLAPVPVAVPPGATLHEIVNDGAPEDGGRQLSAIIACCIGNGVTTTG